MSWRNIDTLRGRSDSSAYYRWWFVIYHILGTPCTKEWNCIVLVGCSFEHQQSIGRERIRILQTDLDEFFKNIDYGPYLAVRIYQSATLRMRQRRFNYGTNVGTSLMDQQMISEDKFLLLTNVFYICLCREILFLYILLTISLSRPSDEIFVL